MAFCEQKAFSLSSRDSLAVPAFNSKRVCSFSRIYFEALQHCIPTQERKLDKELSRRGHVFARYADDFLILVKSAKAAQRVMESIRGKQWKRPRTRRRNLLKLGANPKKVHMATRSRKGYWRMSRNKIVHQCLNNRWLKEQKVPEMRLPPPLSRGISIRRHPADPDEGGIKIWIKLHYGDKSRPVPGV